MDPRSFASGLSHAADSGELHFLSRNKDTAAAIPINRIVTSLKGLSSNNVSLTIKLRKPTVGLAEIELALEGSIEG